VLSSVSSAEAFTTFTNRTAWQAAVDTIAGSVTTTDTFSNNIASAQTITLDSGIVSANSFPPAVAFGDNSVSGGLFFNATDGDFIGTAAGRLNLTGNFDGTGNQTLLVNNSIGGANGFLGIIGNANFSSIVFGNNTNTDDVFQIDSASFASAASVPVAVPEPGMITGLVFLGGGLVVRRLAKRR
jgi:hypothetical protein